MKYDVDQIPNEVTADNTGFPGASNKQLDFLLKLLQERDIPEEARQEVNKRIAAQSVINEEEGDTSPPGERMGLTKRRASEFIGRLLERPKRELQKANRKRDIVDELHPNEPQNRSLPTPEEVPAGRYAIKNADGELRFYKLWRGDRNPNYVSLYVQHSDDFSKVEPFGAAVRIIKQIAEDPAQAARLYGRHLKACSRCGKTLTNRISRLLDIGPVCGGHFYDEAIWSQMRRDARTALEAAGLDPDVDVQDTDDLDSIRERVGLG